MNINHEWKDYLAIVVNCNEINAENRCATAMHTSIPGETLEPIQLLIPIFMLDPLDIMHVDIVFHSGRKLTIRVDPASARDAIPRRRNGPSL